MKELYIKNMVCPRCVFAIEQVLEQQSLEFEEVKLGYVRLKVDLIDTQKIEKLRTEIKSLGFELLDDSKEKLVEKIKTCIINKIFYQSGEALQLNWSDLIAQELSHDYNYLSALFSSSEGTTIEQYIIRQKIERAKELISYKELSLKEIAWQLDYSSVAHLSSQFKRITTFTPSQYRAGMDSTPQRNNLDSVI
ncbi:putative regulatory protein [Arcticibacter svalbardensis MN12-7]|uniref:Putative regulatory protein n=1 Tax=Arcticibacter svalbardensis MN12-7 TaxID=1150600 RepID=R9GPW8_9SPHI|nr:AraC family transcriptional regulator [Arcticibacter svalbardensis]EOR93887.1 putative regulatory protein [Arcticibacter svalbardensis MN12-7]